MALRVSVHQLYLIPLTLRVMDTKHKEVDYMGVDGKTKKPLSIWKRKMYKIDNDDDGLMAGRLCKGIHVSSSLPTVDCSTVDVNKQRKVTQTLWPDHCVQNITSGPTSSKISSRLTRKDTDIVIRKGDTCEVMLSCYDRNQDERLLILILSLVSDLIYNTSSD